LGYFNRLLTLCYSKAAGFFRFSTANIDQQTCQQSGLLTGILNSQRVDEVGPQHLQMTAFMVILWSWWLHHKASLQRKQHTKLILMVLKCTKHFPESLAIIPHPPER
jgi:hypothetical protein